MRSAHISNYMNVKYKGSRVICYRSTALKKGKEISLEEAAAKSLVASGKIKLVVAKKPAPEKIQQFGATVGAVIGGQSAHWMMHAGQWVIVRRQLGKEAIF